MNATSHSFNDVEYMQQNNQQNKLIQLGEMVAMIAHQWRQPLNTISATAINMTLKVQMEELRPEEIEKGAVLIQNQCQKMSQTIETFMEFVRPSKVPQPFMLRHSIDVVLLIMGRQLYTHNIMFHVDERIKGVEVFGYEDQFEQVLLNLFSNARDAFDESTQNEKIMKLSIGKNDEGKYFFAIEDNAGGIPIAIREKIFTPFFTNKEDGKGTGLGLYMSLEIISKSFESTLRYLPIKGGSRFEVLFNPSIINLIA